MRLSGLFPGAPNRCRLNRDDVDLARGVLTVRNSKFGKSRYIPVHESTRQALIIYATQRNCLCPNPGSPSFFLSEHGARVTVWALRRTACHFHVSSR